MNRSALAHLTHSLLLSMLLEANYANPKVFDPFRFARRREEAGEGLKHQMVTPTHEFLVFGIGNHAWCVALLELLCAWDCWLTFSASPGRFFAVNEEKMMMAHILVTYDVKLKDGVRPEDEWVAVIGSANTTAEVMFRKRN
jgi:hypothetical protein